MSKTLVLDIHELYRVIPSTKKLEGQNFKDIGELLKQLVAAIEEDESWDFIQYVNNKPSLFIVRERSREEVDVNKLKKQLKDLVKSAEENAETIAELVPAYATPSVPPPAPSADEFEVDPPEHRSDTGSYVPPVKLPWE